MFYCRLIVTEEEQHVFKNFKIICFKIHRKIKGIPKWTSTSYLWTPNPAVLKSKTMPCLLCFVFYENWLHIQIMSNFIIAFKLSINGISYIFYIHVTLYITFMQLIFVCGGRIFTHDDKHSSHFSSSTVHHMTMSQFAILFLTFTLLSFFFQLQITKTFFFYMSEFI